MSPYKLVINTLEFGDAVAKMQRALTVSFGVPVTQCSLACLVSWQSWPQLIGSDSEILSFYIGASIRRPFASY
jgi:hypothetical protein